MSAERATLPTAKEITACTRCASACEQFERLRQERPDYWNRPVPASGGRHRPLLVVGLAPGLHGANRTGKPFTGDASGDLLWSSLAAFELRQKVRVTNVVKCLPDRNRPSTAELRNCLDFLRRELTARHRVILALGRVAHTQILRALHERARDRPFAHGRIHELENGQVLIDSYHCSRYNTQTGRLTEQMFHAVFRDVCTHLDAEPAGGAP